MAGCLLRLPALPMEGGMAKLTVQLLREAPGLYEACSENLGAPRDFPNVLP